MDQPIIHHSDVECAQDAQWLDQMTIRLIQGCVVILGLFFLAGLGQGLWYAGKWAVTHKETPSATSSTVPSSSTSSAPEGNQGAGIQPDDKAAAGANKPPVGTESQRDDSTTQDDTGGATGGSRPQEEPTGVPGEIPQQGDDNGGTDGQDGGSGDTLGDAWDSAKDTARKGRDQAEEWLRHGADKLRRQSDEGNSDDDASGGNEQEAQGSR